MKIPKKSDFLPEYCPTKKVRHLFVILKMFLDEVNEAVEKRTIDLEYWLIFL